MTDLGFYKRQLRNWFAEYGSEVPDSLFKLAIHAWLELLSSQQSAFNRSTLLQNLALQTFNEFAVAKKNWEER